MHLLQELMLLHVNLMQLHGELRNHQDQFLRINQFLGLLIASNQPGNQTWFPAAVAGLVDDDNNTLN